MANLYCTATNTGKGFFTHYDRNKFYLSGHEGDIWVVGDNSKGAAWINRVSGTSKTKAEAQAVFEVAIEAHQATYDALPAEEQEQAPLARPVKYTLP